MPASGGVHYPHSTIESAGHSLSGHADTLHNAASSASGINLPSGSLGSRASGHAGTLQTHISGVSGHISTIAEREGSHGDTLVRNSTNMRNTDSDHANAFNHLGNRSPLRITNGPGGVIDGRMPVGEHGQVWNMGEQAWNGGNPAGGLNRPNPNGVGNSTWYGQAQVPFTPAWNPGNNPALPPHGSGDGNSPHAGDIVNIQGFHRPMDPANPGVQHPATYFPQPPANQPPVPPPDPNWADTSPKRTYDDPNYPE